MDEIVILLLTKIIYTMFFAFMDCINLTDTARILFWVFTAILAYRTYENAKKTLFNPIRSEMVKYQMKVITEFIDKYTSKGVNFESSINYSLLIKLNYDVDYLLYSYSGENLFDSHVLNTADEDILKFCRENFAGLFEARQVQKGKLYFDNTVIGDFDSMKEYINTALVKAKESENKSLILQRIFFTTQFYSFYSDLLNLEANPFIPEEIKKYVIVIIENINKNLRILYEILSEYIVEQKPGKYQDMLNDLNRKKISHDEDLKNLRKQITLFFKVNNI